MESSVGDPIKDVWPSGKSVELLGEQDLTFKTAVSRDWNFSGVFINTLRLGFSFLFNGVNISASRDCAE